MPVDSEIPVGSKTKKGRKAIQDYADATVELAQAPVVKHDRRKYLDKTERQHLEEPKSVTGTTFKAAWVGFPPRQSLLRWLPE